MSSFRPKRLRVTFVMARADAIFPGTNSNTLTLDNMRISAKVQSVNRLSTQAELRIYGMKAADMDALSVNWARVPAIFNNLVIIEADSGRGFSQVFKGTLIEAQPDYNGAPDVAFTALAMTGYFEKITPVAPMSLPAASDIDTIAAGIAADMGLTFHNGGAFGTLAEGAYFWGTLYDQLAAACEATKTDFYIFGDTLLITPAGAPQSDVPAVRLTRESGLIGYPMFERSGLLISAMYDPAFLCGTAIEVDGDVPAANGRWYPYRMLHVLDSLNPRGQWMTQMQCSPVIT